MCRTLSGCEGVEVMVRSLFGVAFLCTAIVTGLPASAEIIFDNGETISLGGVSSDGTTVTIFDNFVLDPGANTITGIRWWGFYLDQDKVILPTDDFTVFIYADNAGTPAAAPLQTYTNTVDRAPNGTSSFGIPEYEYFMAIDPLELTAGTTYWLAIANSTQGPVKGEIVLDSPWFWAFSGVQGGDAQAKTPTAWINLRSEMAFQLEGTVVPEPASIVLMGLGLGTLAWRARQKRR